MSLFEEITLREITLRNRIALAPMSQYCASDHRANDWHLAHYMTRALGLGLVIVEATAVSPEGAVTPYDLGLWEDGFVGPLSRIAQAIRAQGAVAGIQLSHGGRKSSRTRPWEGDDWIRPESGGWPVLGPSSMAFAAGYAIPHVISTAQIQQVIADFGHAARRARSAGFQLLELHAGHGRLIHSFLSPLANTRTDEWGGSFENRCRLLLDIVREVRWHWPAELPLAIRISCVDWLDGGWTIDDSVRLCELLSPLGVDLIDCTSGGIQRPLKVEPKPGYQVGFAREIRSRAGVATAAVGLIHDLWQAQQVVDAGDADVVLMGRSLLLDPLQVIRSAANGLAPMSSVAPQYRRALNSLTPSLQRADDFVPEL